MKIQKTKKGMSLIVLVITIIVMIILSGVIVIGLSSNNPIEKAYDAKFEADFANYKEELSSYLINRLYEDYKFNPETINATLGDMQKYIKSMKDENLEDFEIVKGELIYVGIRDDELAAEIYSQGLVAYFSPLTAPIYEPAGDYWYWPITMIGEQKSCSIKGVKICGWNFPAGVEEQYKNGEYSTFAGSAGAAYPSGYDPVGKSYNLDGYNDYMIIDDDMITDVTANKRATSKITNIGKDGTFTVTVTAVARKFNTMSKILVQRPNFECYNFIGFTNNSLGKLAPYLGARNYGPYTDLKGSVKVSVEDFPMQSFASIAGVFNNKESELYINGKKAYSELHNASSFNVNQIPAYWNVGRQHTESENSKEQYSALSIKTIAFWEEALDANTIYQNSKIEQKWEETNEFVEKIRGIFI